MNKKDNTAKSFHAQNKALDAARSFAPPSSLNADALGSYTGYTERQHDYPAWDWDEGPVQDADDL